MSTRRDNQENVAPADTVSLSEKGDSVNIWAQDTSQRIILGDCSNIPTFSSSQSMRRSSASPQTKKVKAMGSDLNSLAAQIVKNTEESRLLRELLLANGQPAQSILNAAGMGISQPATTPRPTQPAGTKRYERTKEHPNPAPQIARRSAAEQRARHREVVKAARDRREQAWVNATRSIECVKRNMDRFSKQVDEEQMLYPELNSDLDNSHMTDEVLAFFRVLREANPHQDGKKCVKVVLPSCQLRNRLVYLKDHAFVLYTENIAPALETVEHWTKTILEQQMNFRITGVRPLNKHCFLITVDNDFDRDTILAATPLYLGGNHMVFALPWVATFNPADITSSKEELPETLEIEDEETGASYHQKIIYRNLPDACFKCHQRGHIIRECPLRRQPTLPITHTKGEEDKEVGRRVPGTSKPQIDADGFTHVGRGKASSKQGTKIHTTNPYEALQTEEPDNEDTDSETEPAQGNSGKARTTNPNHGTISTPRGPMSQGAGSAPQKGSAPVDMEEQDESGLNGEADMMDFAKDKRKRNENEAEVDQQGLDAIMLQEMRIKQQLTERRLYELAEGNQFVVDYTAEGKAGAAIIILNKNWKIREQGVKGDGYLAWAVVDTDDGPLGLASVHRPRERETTEKICGTGWNRNGKKDVGFSGVTGIAWRPLSTMWETPRCRWEVNDGNGRASSLIKILKTGGLMQREEKGPFLHGNRWLGAGWTMRASTGSTTRPAVNGRG
ncbi:hypothetical protein R1sor_006095 [Riccia sorocarpa]|uniref:CCHC-type domain-containing protein n=1 Tax=Riccia sorocarpa TaxID=122646 RepID=A0ABD3HQ35_9MARC